MLPLLSFSHLDDDTLLGSRPVLKGLLRVIRSAHSRGGARILTHMGGARTSIVIPPSILDDLDTIVSALARGQRVCVFPTDVELSTSQAAAMLGVSRPTIVRLMDEGVIGYWFAGKHRRTNAGYLSAYMNSRGDQ